jgi:site-specific recombinase XerC
MITAGIRLAAWCFILILFVRACALPPSIPASHETSPSNVLERILRHATGYYLSERGADLRVIQAYLGHREIRHTVRYVQLSQGRFDGLWDD